TKAHRSPVVLIIFLHPTADHLDLHSFPTRRSSDLPIDRRRNRCPTTGTNHHSFPRQKPQLTDDQTPARHRPICRCKHPINCGFRSEEHTSELQSLRHLVCRLLPEKKKKQPIISLHS